MNLNFKYVTLTAFMIPLMSLAQNDELSDSITKQLQEIVITAKQPATRLDGTTLVTTVSGSGLQHIGTALDVLAQLPMMQVENTDVSVSGKNDIEIYIDGRPVHDTKELQHLLSSDMKKVELLMSPGAEYKSTVGAVIKITTQRNIIKGLSLTAISQSQHRRKWSLSQTVDVNYRISGWDIFAYGDFSHNNSLTKGSSINRLIYNGETTTIGSTQNNNYKANASSVKAGFNYTDGKQSLGAYYNLNPEHSDFTNNGTEWLNDSHPEERCITRNTKAGSHMVSAYYDNTVGNKYHLHFDGDFRSAYIDNDVTTSYPNAELSLVKSTDHNRSTLWAGKLYCDFPLLKGNFSAGAQSSFTRSSLDYIMRNPEIDSYVPSSLSASRQISAGMFASWAYMTGRWSMSLGARYEYSDYTFTLNNVKDNNISRTDHMFTPDISLGYTFSPTAQLNISYNTATVKPPYARITGSRNYVGIHELEGGNPGLRDETMHNLQIFGMWKNFILQADYVYSNDSYAFVKQLYEAPTLQLLLHPINIDVSSVNLYLIWSNTFRFWRPDYTIGLYRQWLNIDEIKYDKPIFSYYFANTFTLPHDIAITANLSGQTEGDMHTNRFNTTWFTMNASVSKAFLNKALTVKISATDIFNTANNNWTIYTYGISFDKRQSYDRRGITLNVAYRFRPQKSKYKGKAASEAELKRL